ncbi:MAG: hypothetical protein HYZ29_36670 [Myxococcales bacterium]|nr:hypothetical protein [Myxococcales bacterium]
MDVRGSCPGDGPDRRGARRDDTLAALGEMLDSVRSDSDFRAIALADGSGVLVAGAGAFSACEELAAFAPLALSRVANDIVPTRVDVALRKMQVRRLTIDGIEVLLCGDGGESDALRKAAAGCARILGARRQRA